MSTEATNTLSLWTTLHDGILEALRSDLTRRTLSFVIDSSFHREFHYLPSETKIQIVGHGVHSVAAFAFEPGSGSTEPPRSTPWQEAQEQRRRDAAKERLISTDWTAFALQVGTDEGHIIMTADLAQEHVRSVLRLDMLCPSSDHRDIEVHAEQFRFLIGDRELSLEEFAQFGDAYWDDWSRRSVKNSEKSGISQVQKPE